MKRPGKRLPSARSLLGTALALVALLASVPPAAAWSPPSPSGGSPRPVVALIVVLALFVVGGLGYLWYAGKL
ncbi:hypothetical protein, partial [Streptomyces sp. BF23-30]|uniref:hypothetical protein n=1 Tax=Streptomyces sp. BF23-30 TaxID=3240281 RepID=UPI0034E57017